ncbi:MAG TPA: hypothetical protein DGT21_21380 [Armatimonadetes bacterium]|nr:hypothetical protein [Armatimonadota bacterium]
MSANHWSDVVANALRNGGATPPPYKLVLAELRGFASALQDELGAAVAVRVEPGFQTNAGQQFHLRLRIPAQGFEETLFRAYVPVDGYPVGLDFNAEDLVNAADVEQLRSLIGEFISRDTIRARLDLLRETAAN